MVKADESRAGGTFHQIPILKFCGSRHLGKMPTMSPVSHSLSLLPMKRNGRAVSKTITLVLSAVIPKMKPSSVFRGIPLTWW